MNFQAVSVGQKLACCGYTDPEATPSAGLANAIRAVNNRDAVGKIKLDLMIERPEKIFDFEGPNSQRSPQFEHIWLESNVT